MNALYIGLAFSVLIGVFENKIKESPLTLGTYSLKNTFFFFGVIGFTLISILLIWLLTSLLYNTPINSLYFYLSIGTCCLPLGVYSGSVFLGLWRSSRKLKTIQRIIFRYFSIFYLSIGIVAALFSFYYLIVAFLLFLLKQKINNKTKTTKYNLS